LKRFSEGELKFDPTYKYDATSNDYDTSQKKRIPAWCDRILFEKSQKCMAGSIDLLEYGRKENNFSDHRPVYAIFDARVCSIDFVKKKEIEDNLLGTLFKGPPPPVKKQP
jgi:hypothetical protein